MGVSFNPPKKKKTKSIQYTNLKYNMFFLMMFVSMEPQDVRRECWTVALGNAHSQEERMVGAG